MEIDLGVLLKGKSILGVHKNTVLEEFLRTKKVSESDKIVYTDDEDFFSFMIDWNEFFFEKDKLSSVNIDLSHDIYLFDRQYRLNPKLDLNSMIMYLNLFDIEWSFFGKNCFSKQLSVLFNEVMFVFTEKGNNMVLNKIKIFPSLK